MKMRILSFAVFLGALAVVAAVSGDKGFVAHEWGTFTCVQGADGVQMDWNPLVIAELPKFVYDRARPGNPSVRRRVGNIVVAGKLGTVCRQRMETPVIYFYSDAARTVNVSVRFPQGQVTEWYPDEIAGYPGLPSAAVSVPALQWSQVQIQPASAAEVALPRDESGSHYYAARETDASYVRTGAGQKSETEKFLFYRGVGSFQAPLTVKLDSADSDRISLTNSGAEELPDLFLCEVRADGVVAWTPLGKLAAGQMQSVALSSAPESGTAGLAAALRAALVRQGLYEKEAAAMVKTWETSWLGERGVRVLYTLPRAWTDRTLPLTIAPAPKAIERVMVGRAEIITPAMETALLSAVNRYIAATAEERPKIVAETRALGLGRFTPAAMTRLMTSAPRTPEFNTLAWQLASAASAPPKLDVR